MTPKPVTLGLVGNDGAVITWSREDAADLCSAGSFSGDPTLVDNVLLILVRRTRIDLPTGVQWTFLPEPQTRPADVAAAMITAIEVASDMSDLLTRFPELNPPPHHPAPSDQPAPPDRKRFGTP